MVYRHAFYRNKAYHTARDTPERLDYHKMEVIQGSIQAIINLRMKPHRFESDSVCPAISLLYLHGSTFASS